MLGGTNPDLLSLRDWCDAGQRMLTEGITDPVMLSAFGRLFTAETEDDVTSTFTEMGRIGEHYQAEFRRAEDKARAEMGVPRVVSVSELDQAAADWGAPVPKDVPADG